MKKLAVMGLVAVFVFSSMVQVADSESSYLSVPEIEIVEAV